MLQFWKLYFLSGKVLNVFLLKGNIITGIVEPFLFKYSSETNKQANNNHTTLICDTGKLGRADGILFPSLLGHLHCVGLFRNWRLETCVVFWQPWWSDCEGRVSPCLGQAVFVEVLRVHWSWGLSWAVRGRPWVGKHAECSVGACWRNQA